MAGPIAKDVFIDLSEEVILLQDFIKIEMKDNALYITAVDSFCNDEFSDCEIQLMGEIVRKYGQMPVGLMMDEIHKEGTLWYETAKENGLLEDFSRVISNNSSFLIDFTKGLTECAKEHYLDSLAIHQTANILKVHFL